MLGQGMSAAPEELVGLPIGWQVAATRVHEGILRALGGDPLIEALLTLHAPHPPQVSDDRSHTVVEVFGCLDGRPVCRGCERAELTPTRAPAWPCRTYTLIGRQLLGRDVALEYTELATDDPARPRERTSALRRAHSRSLIGPVWAVGEGHP